MTMSRINKLTLTLLILLSVFFRFYGITKLDVQHDQALNSFRAVGYEDYLADDNQTTPLVWLGVMPWWSKLSFHDHPPLSFIIQHFFFAVFGDNDLSAFLPFAVTGVASVILLWFLLYRSTDAPSATIGTALLAVGSYGVWMSRTGYIEGIQVFFVIAVVFFLKLLIDRGDLSSALGLNLYLGCALMTKYTSIFLIPTILAAIWLHNKKLFSQKRFWLSWLIVPVMMLPVIIFNIFVFQTRGHFDAALSSMLGMHTADYQALFNRSVNLNLVANAESVISIFLRNESLPTTVILGIVFCASIVMLWRRKNSVLQTIATLGILFASAMFLVAGAQARFLTILMPLFSILLGISIYAVRKEAPELRRISYTILSVVAVIECFYSINTNLLLTPLGHAGISFATDRFYQRNYHALDEYLRSTVYGPLPPRKKILTMADTKVGIDQSLNNTIIIDERMNWFSFIWYLRRYQFYYDRPIVSLNYVLKLMNESNPGDTNFFAFLQSRGAKHFWFITIDGDVQPDSDEGREYNKYIDVIETTLQWAKAPVHAIHNTTPPSTIKVYDVTL